MVCQEVSGSASWLSNDFGSASGLSGSASGLSEVDPDNQLADPDNPFADPDNQPIGGSQTQSVMVYGLRFKVYSIVQSHEKSNKTQTMLTVFTFVMLFFC